MAKEATNTPILPPASYADLPSLSDAELITLRSSLDVEMRRRGIALTVGDIGELLAIRHYNSTPGLPNLQNTSVGTKNIDAVSRTGERYSIKTILKTKKTSTIYPDPEDRDKQLFEQLLIVRISPSWELLEIYQLDWRDFVERRSWDTRMNAWYLAATRRVLTPDKCIFQRPSTTNG